MANKAEIASFIKANKTRRIKIAIKNGFSTAELYLDSLKNGKGATPPKKGKDKKKKDEIPTIHIVEILDRSSSMNTGNKIKVAVAGINEEIEALKGKKDIKYTFSLISFSDSSRTDAYKVPIDDINYKYSIYGSGMTALYQTVGETLNKFAAEANGVDKYLVKIFTDGEENASLGGWHGSTGAKRVSELINSLKEKGFTVTFVGTEFDVKNAIVNLNVDASNTLVHDNTMSGVQAAFMTSTNATSLYSKKVLNKEDVSRGFYKKIGQLQ